MLPYQIYKLCYILTHNDGITNELSQEQKLEYIFIIQEKDMNICIVIYRRPKQPFWDTVLWTQELYSNHTTKNHSIAKIHESIYCFERSSQEYNWMVG